jgi:ketosteroid isomerase-like protein
MVTTRVATMIDEETATRLSERFNDVFCTFDAGDDLFTADAFFDLNMPVWRFQLRGGDAFAAQIKNISQGPARVDILRTLPTASGFVTEHEEHQAVGGQDLSARRVWVCDVRDGRICEVTGYCSGEWDDELRARHAAEAPMIRK